MNSLIGVLMLMIMADDPQFTMNGVAKVSWDPVTMDVNEGPEQIAYYEVGLFKDTMLTKSEQVTETFIVVADLIAGQPDGAYQIKVRAVDLAGNESDWSTPLVGIIDTVKPKAPTGIKGEQ